MIGPWVFLGAVFAGAVSAAVLLPVIGVYVVVVQDFLDRVEWEDGATLRGKSRVTYRWTREHTNWEIFPEAIVRCALAGGGTVALLLLLAAGAWSIFLA